MPELKPHRLLCLTLLGLALGGCDLLTGPGSGEFIYRLMPGNVERIDLESGAVEPFFSFPAPTVGSFDTLGSAILIVTREEVGSPFRFHELDLCSKHIEWTMHQGHADQTGEVAEIALEYPSGVDLSRDGSTLYVSKAFRNDTPGVAAINRSNRALSGFIGPFEHPNAREFRRMAGYHDGLIRVIGMRTDRSPAVLYFFHPATFELVDSLPPTSIGLTNIWAAQASADGRTLYGYGNRDLFRYDMVDRSIVARYSPERWRPWGMAETGGGQFVALDWPYYGREYPGSGLVYVFGADLELIGRVDVSTPVGGEPYTSTATRTAGLLISRDGGTAYVSAVGASGSLYGEQPARIFIVDLQTLTVTRIVEIGGRSMGPLILPPRC